MRRIIASFLMLVFTLGAQAGDKSRLDEILERGELRVGTTGDWDPMSVRNPVTNEYQGFDIDLAKALAKDMGVKVTFVPADWKTLVNGVVAGKYDMTGSASINMSRARVAGYSDPYFTLGTVPVTLKSKAKKYASWDDLNKAEVRVAVTLGTVFEAEAKSGLPKAKLKTVEAPARDFQEVLSRRADVALTSTLEAAKLVKKYPQLAILSFEPRQAKHLALLLPQEDQVWINYINHWIRYRQAQGLFRALETKWIKESAN
ncbi:transporter substrate-binding domain-containing protein [Spongorhabdus nitratireducens]